MAASAILLVEGDQDTCASRSEVIWDLGYRVVAAYDGPAAVELSRRDTRGLTILDERMPGMNGVELCDRVQ
jgi:CheY-like chemotaxis protein